MSKWTPDAMPSQSGRTVLITGASSGIGLAAARELAAKGAHVIAAVRDRDKGHHVLGADVDIRRLDLADLDSVRAFVDEVDRPVDVLLNNAGVMAVPLGRTVQGFELQIGTNHLGHFALTGLLLDRITDRIVTVSSTAHRMGRIRLDDINWSKAYRRWPAYGQSKLANLLFTSELQRRLANAGRSLRAIAVHPGYASTALQSKTESTLQDGFMALANRFIAQSETQGAWPSLYAISENVPGNSFIGPDGFGEISGHPTFVDRSARARDTETAMRLWELSERLTGVRYGL